MGELTVTEWRKFGKHRAYVNTPAGERVGWLDLLTGEEAIELPQHTESFWTSLRAAGHDPGPRPMTARQGLDPAIEPDLAYNRPGQAVREQASAEWAAAKQRAPVGARLRRAFDTNTQERSWRLGADGEEAVGARLDRLTKRGWYVLHSVEVGNRGSDIDHVLIGHGGVYTINTKNHPGAKVWVSQRQVRVNGHPVPYLQKSRHEAERAARLLSTAVGFPVPVRAALVILTGTLIPNVTIKSQPDDVIVLDRMDIPGAFRRAPVRLSPAAIEAIFEAARRQSTWTT